MIYNLLNLPKAQLVLIRVWYGLKITNPQSLCIVPNFQLLLTRHVISAYH